MNFGCRHFEHKVTSLTASDTAVNMTITNNTNISDLDCFELVLCVNPNTVVTGAPLPYTITVNGTAVSLYNKYYLPVYTNRLRSRKKYYGAYVATDGGTPYVILFNTPDCPQFARS